MDLQEALGSGRDGAVRREVRRPRARDPHRRLLDRALRRHPSRRHRPDRPLQGDRRGRGRLRRAPHRGGHRRARARARGPRGGARCASRPACSRSRRSSCPAASPQLLEEQKRLEKQLAQLESKLARSQAAGPGGRPRGRWPACRCWPARLDGLDPDGLRAVVDTLRDRLPSGIIVARQRRGRQGEPRGGGLQGPDEALPGGPLVQEVARMVGGGGGGRPDLAQAGGKDAVQARRGPRRGGGLGGADGPGLARRPTGRTWRSTAARSSSWTTSPGWRSQRGRGGGAPLGRAVVTFAPGPAARRTVRTMCPMNCHPTLCGMLVDVEDGRLVGVARRPGQSRQPRLPLRARPGLARDHRQPAAPAPPARPRAARRRRLAPGDVGRGARPASPTRMRAVGPRGGRPLVGARALRQQLRHARRLAPAAPLRQPLGLPVVDARP